MKTNMILKLAFFILLISSLAFNVCFSTQENSNLILTSKQSVSNSQVDTCRAAKQLVTGVFQISDSCAKVYIDTYQSTIKQAKDSLANRTNIDTSLLLKGAYVEMDELQRVLHYANFNDDTTASLFIMLGIKDSSTHLIFTLQNDSLKNPSTINTSGFTPKRNTLYFDFTIPCPSTCPK